MKFHNSKTAGKFKILKNGSNPQYSQYINQQIVQRASSTARKHFMLSEMPTSRHLQPTRRIASPNMQAILYGDVLNAGTSSQRMQKDLQVNCSKKLIPSGFQLPKQKRRKRKVSRKLFHPVRKSNRSIKERVYSKKMNVVFQDSIWLQDLVRNIRDFKQVMENKQLANQIIKNCLSELQLLPQLILLNRIQMRILDSIPRINENLRSPSFIALRNKYKADALYSEITYLKDCLKLQLQKKQFMSINESFRSLAEDSNRISKLSRKFSKEKIGVSLDRKELEVAQFWKEIEEYEKEHGQFPLISKRTRKIEETLNDFCKKKKV